MSVGVSIYSSNGQYFLVFQADGNLVLYRIDGKVIWNSDTTNKAIGGSCGMDAYGGFEIRDMNGNQVFSTGTGVYPTVYNPGERKPGVSLVVEDWGNIIIYDAINTMLWASNAADSGKPEPTVKVKPFTIPPRYSTGPHPKNVIPVHSAGGTGASSNTTPQWTAPIFTPVQPPPRKTFFSVFLPWQQDWVLKGYTRGRLMQTLTLAPQEETTIEIFSWDRRKKALEQSTSTDVEQSFDDSSTTRDTDDVYKEMTKSNDFQWQVSGELNATYRPGVAEIGIKAAGGASNKSTIGSVAKETTAHLHESVSKASTRVKTTRTTRITESTETGTENRVTRKIRNQNLCHTLTLDYFETLVHYDIETNLKTDEIRLCAMILNPLSMITVDDLLIRTHETTLRNALLDSALVDGFEACRTLQAWKNAIAILADQKKVRMDEAAAEASAAEKAASSTGPTIPPTPPKPVSKEEKALLSLLKDIGVATGQLMTGEIDNVLTLIGLHSKLTADQIASAKRWLFLQLLYWYYPSLVDVLKSIPPLADGVSTELARKLYQALPSKGSSPSPSSFNDLTDVEKEKVLSPAIRNGHLTAEGDWPWWSGSLRDYGIYLPEDAGLPGLLSSFENAYVSYLNNESSKDDEGNTPGDQAVLQANATQDKANDQDMLEMKFGLDVIANAQEREEALKKHLLEHLNYYKYVLFQAQPPSEQLEQIMTMSELQVGSFEPHVVSMRGEYLAIPLITALDPKLDKMLQDLINELKDIPSPKTKSIMLPSQGMTIESRLGKCSTCEDYIEKSRSIEIDRLTAVAKQAEYEANRYKARLDANPQLLDNPTPPSDTLPIRLETAKAPV